MSDSKMHSTGRGGAGNIGKDPNTYVDGDIVREGVVGQPSHAGGGEYSAGRGGAGNMVPSPSIKPTTGSKDPATGKETGLKDPGSVETIPEPAMKAGEQYADFHTGRGGEGNIHRDKYGGHSKPQTPEGGKKEGLLDKAKHAIGLDKKKEGES